MGKFSIAEMRDVPANAGIQTAVASPAAEEIAVLDLSQLAELQNALDPTALREFILLYLVDVNLHLEEIARARARQDFGRVASEAHMLVNTSGNLGAMKTSQAARRLENACRTGDHQNTYRLISELAEACAQSGAAFRAWRNDNRALGAA